MKIMRTGLSYGKYGFLFRKIGTILYNMGLGILFSIYGKGMEERRMGKEQRVGASRGNTENKNTLFELISAHRSELMGFAALWIVIFHVWKPVLSAIPVLHEAEAFVRTFGFFGVDIFFFASGMGLVFSIERHSLGRFYYNRLKRLIIPYFAVGIVRVPLEGWSLYKTIGILSGYCFFFRSIYWYLWFIQGIALLYLLFPLLYRIMKRTGHPILVTLFAMALWFALSQYCSRVRQSDITGFLDRIPIFLLGTLLGYMGREGVPKYRRAFVPMAMGMLIVGAAMAGAYVRLSLPGNLWYGFSFGSKLLVSLALCVLIPALMEALGARGKGLEAVLAFYGRISLEFYCVQDLFARDYLIAWLEPLPPLAFNVLAIAEATLIAWLAHEVISAFWKRIDARLAARQARTRP